MGHLRSKKKVAFELPFGYFPQPVYFATVARRHMIEFGTTVEQLGAIAVACRRHANVTPGAIMHDRKMTIDDYLAAPMVASPLRIPDCCLISDGGAAFVTTSADRARDLRHRPVAVAGVGKGISGDGYDWSRTAGVRVHPPGVCRPGCVCHGCPPPSRCRRPRRLRPLHNLVPHPDRRHGILRQGEGGPFASDGRLHFDSGQLPYNTHGGFLFHAYVLGIAHVVELVKQLRGVAAAQVPGAEVAVYGGYTGGDAATLVLTRGD